MISFEEHLLRSIKQHINNMASYPGVEHIPGVLYECVGLLDKHVAEEGDEQKEDIP